MKSERLLEIVEKLAATWPRFFEVQGPSAGDKSTAAFMRELRQRATTVFGADYAEQRICGANGNCVDYYFPDEETIVEIALSLRNPTSEFERDILKAIMAQGAGHAVRYLVFITKSGGAKRCNQPGARAIIEWAARVHGLTITVEEIRPRTPA